MSKLNIDRIAQLIGYGKLNETADYDFGGVEPRTQKVPFEPSKSGQANLPVRNVNKQGDNPLEMEEGMEGTCEPDPQFDGLDEDYIRTMIDMMKRTPVMSSSEANMQWMAAANAELARRETFAQMSAQADAEAAMAAQAIVTPEPSQVSAPVCDVMIDRAGFPEHMTVIQDGRFFVTAMNNDTGATETFPRDEWDQIVLDNDSMYDNVRVGDRLPDYDAANDEDDMVVLGIGEDEEMEEGVELDMPGHRDDADDEEDEDEEDLDEGVMDVIRQHVNPETLSKAHSVLMKAGVSDVAILNRDVNMKASGWTKLAHILTNEPMADADAEDYCKHVLHALADKLESGTLAEDVQLDEFEGMGGDQRFGYTTDALGNVNVSDARTGASLYLQGQDAQELLGTLTLHGSTPEAVQAILSQYEHALDGQVDADGEEVGLNIPTDDDAVDAFGF